MRRLSAGCWPPGRTSSGSSGPVTYWTCPRARSSTPDPPSNWERASGPMRGALIGGMLFEGLAADAEDAEREARRR